MTRKTLLRRLESRARLVNAAARLTWLDREASAAYLGIGLTKLDELATLGVLKPAKLGRRTIFSRQQMDEYMAKLININRQVALQP